MSLDAHHAPLRGETVAPASTWRPVTDDLRVRHVAGPTAVDATRERHPLTMAVVLEGTCLLRRAGASTRLPRATLLVDLDTGLLEVPDGARLYLASFRSVSAGRGILEASPGLEQVTSVDPALVRTTESVLTSLLQEPPTGPFSRHLLDRTVRDLFGALVLDGRLRPMRAQQHSLYSAALHHIVDHYADTDLGPETIAAAFTVSVRHLSRAFRDNGTTVTRCIISTRVSVAVALLSQQPDLGLTELSEECGFSSLQAMRRAFKAEGRESPSTLRTLAAARHRAANQSRSVARRRA